MSGRRIFYAVDWAKGEDLSCRLGYTVESDGSIRIVSEEFITAEQRKLRERLRRDAEARRN